MSLRASEEERSFARQAEDAIEGSLTSERCHIIKTNYQDCVAEEEEELKFSALGSIGMAIRYLGREGLSDDSECSRCQGFCTKERCLVTAPAEEPKEKGRAREEDEGMDIEGDDTVGQSYKIPRLNTLRTGHFCWVCGKDLGGHFKGTFPWPMLFLSQPLKPQNLIHD